MREDVPHGILRHPGAFTLLSWLGFLLAQGATLLVMGLVAPRIGDPDYPESPYDLWVVILAAVWGP